MLTETLACMVAANKGGIGVAELACRSQSRRCGTYVQFFLLRVEAENHVEHLLE